MEDHPDSDKAVSHCKRCDSLWFGKGVLEEILAQAENQASQNQGGGSEAPLPTRAPQAVEYRNCPSCGTQMLRSNYGRISGIIIDTCRPHGTFLDSGEFEAIHRFVHAGGAAAARKSEQAEARYLADAEERSKKRTETWRQIARGRANAHDFIYPPACDSPWVNSPVFDWMAPRCKY